VHFVGSHYIIVTVQFASLSYINCAQLHMHLVTASCHTNCNQHSTSEEQSPHASPHSLSVIQNVKFVYKLIDIIAAFGDGSQVCHEAHIIALL
jgi:hypothetical protein